MKLDELFPIEQVRRLEAYLDSETERKDLLAVLHRAQEIFGYVPAEVQRYLAARLELSLSRVEGVMQFYDYLSSEPRELPAVAGAYRIAAKQCVGCTACRRVCPVECIEGVRKRPHRIIEEECIACGACFKACKFSAILRPTTI